MPGIKARKIKRRRLAYLALLGVGVLALSELFSNGLSRFWANHPMITAVIAFAFSVAVTILVVEEARGQREARRWATLGDIAQRHLSGAAFRVCAGILQGTGWDEAGERLNDAAEHLEKTGERPGREAPALLPETYENDLAEALQDSEYRLALADAVGPLTEELDSALAQWAVIMIATPDLAERLQPFSLLRETIGPLSGYLRRYGDSLQDETMFWSTLRILLLLFASVDALRREAIGEKNLFGETADDHDRAWGLPFKAQRWLWEKDLGDTLPPA
jgi:hypothetical protein